ncbi:MAG TPA: helix-turn-helix transcriptional regulator, partial [Roseomonas sp.]
MSANGQPPYRDIAQDRVDRPLAAYARDYADGHDTGRHIHARAQLLYATAGVMRIATDATSFVVPPGRGLFVPPRLPHVVRMEGMVAMRALFLREDATLGAPPPARVLAVTPLLRELILAACAEPMEWDEAGRGGQLAALILSELARAEALPLAVPEPRDPRLMRLTAALRADPARRLTLDDWAVDCGASQRTLRRLFAAETGMGFSQWRQAL